MSLKKQKDSLSLVKEYYSFEILDLFLSLKFLVIIFLVIVFLVFSTLWYFSIDLPDYKKLSNYQPPISSRVYSEDSKLIAEYAIDYIIV